MAISEKELERLDRLAGLLDDRFRIPGTSIRMGLDGLIGLIPGIGDTVALAPTAYVVLRAMELGAPKRLVARMAGNAFIDWLIGLIPLLGDVFDIGFKANRRNVELLRRHLKEQS
ncbi:MAG: DUF4112 domain-containing protein [Alphaproteobacteria bacterium]